MLKESHTFKKRAYLQVVSATDCRYGATAHSAAENFSLINTRLCPHCWPAA